MVTTGFIISLFDSFLGHVYAADCSACPDGENISAECLFLETAVHFVHGQLQHSTVMTLEFSSSPEVVPTL